MCPFTKELAFSLFTRENVTQTHSCRTVTGRFLGFLRADTFDCPQRIWVGKQAISVHSRLPPCTSTHCGAATSSHMPLGCVQVHTSQEGQLANPHRTTFTLNKKHAASEPQGRTGHGPHLITHSAFYPKLCRKQLKSTCRTVNI